MSVDVLVPATRDLFWKRPGSRGGWLYVGPIAAPTEESLLPGRDADLEIVALFSVVPDSMSQFWVFSGRKFEPRTVAEHLCYLPLRYKGLVFEECVNRAKSYLVDRLFPELRPDQRVNVDWSRAQGIWTLRADERMSEFSDIEGDDPLVALAKAIKATDAAR